MRSADIRPFRRTPAICLFLAVGMLPSTPGLSQTFESGSRHVSQKNPFQSLIEKIVENTHPSVLGAHGTGQLLAREMPVIMQRLRDTRSAIEALGNEDFRGRSVSPREQPFAFVKDPSDREVLVRDLENLQYLLRELDIAVAAGDTALVEDFRAEIERKNRDVGRILGSWGRELDEEEERAGPGKPGLTGVWASTYGDIHWSAGWYGNENKTLSPGALTRVEDGWVMRGTWGRRNDPNRKGGFEFRFDGPCSFSGAWWYASSPDSRTGWSGSCKTSK